MCMYIFFFIILFWGNKFRWKLIRRCLIKYTRPSIPRHCPRSLAKLMEQCWDTDPTKRPEMEEVVVILEEIKKSQELQSRWRHPVGWFKLFKLRRR